MTLTPAQVAYCRGVAQAAPPPTPEVFERLAALLPLLPAEEDRAA